MRILIAGGHGKVALMLERILSGDRHDVVAVVRDADQVADVEAMGASALVLDLETTNAVTLASHLAGVDAVVFAVTAAAAVREKRRSRLDRHGATLLADAAELAGVHRVIVISSLDADQFDPHSKDAFQRYLKARSEADADIRARDWLDWTIVRPGRLTDEPSTGMVRVSDSVPRGSIARADVAALVAALVTGRKAIRRQVEVVARDAPVAQVALQVAAFQTAS